VNNIITNVLNESISFQNILKNDRFSNQLQYISQKALSVCDESEIDGKKKFFFSIIIIIILLIIYILYIFYSVC